MDLEKSLSFIQTQSQFKMETSQQVPNNIKEKIAKLLRQSESNEKNGSEAALNEAMVAMAKVQEMLAKYNLDIEAVRSHDEKSKQTLIKDQEDLTLVKTEGKWVKLLYQVISTHNLCQIIYSDRGKLRYTVWILGEPHNIELVKFLCEILQPKLRKMARTSWAEYSRGYGESKKNAYIRAYLQGAVLGIDYKLRDEKKNVYQSQPQYQALVRVKGVELENFVNQSFPNLKIGRGTSQLSSSDGTQHGIRDGRNINLQKPISNSGFGPKQLN